MKIEEEKLLPKMVRLLREIKDLVDGKKLNRPN